MPRCRIRHQTRLYRGLTHLILLCALPTVRVGQHKINLALDRVPQQRAVGFCVLYVRRGAFVQIREEVSEDVDDGLTIRKGRNVVGYLFTCTRRDLGTQM